MVSTNPAAIRAALLDAGKSWDTTALDNYSEWALAHIKHQDEVHKRINDDYSLDTDRIVGLVYGGMRRQGR